MADEQDKIDRLEQSLDDPVRTQISFQHEITLIRVKLIHPRATAKTAESPPDVSFYVPPTARQQPFSPRPSQPDTAPAQTCLEVSPTFGMQGNGHETSKRYDAAHEPYDYFSDRISAHIDNARANLERSIGENLIGEIDTVVFIPGIGIGAKYAIDNNLISPLKRIIIAYIFGLGLVGLAARLKLMLIVSFLYNKYLKAPLRAVSHRNVPAREKLTDLCFRRT